MGNEMSEFKKYGHGDDAPMHREYQGDGCLVCGREVKNQKFFMNLTVDHQIWSNAEGACEAGIDQGFFVIGSECAKKFEDGVLFEEGA